MNLITHVWTGEANDAEITRRMAVAAASWKREAKSYGAWRDKKFVAPSKERSAISVGDTVQLPFIHDMVNACLSCEDDDIIFITNADIGIYQGCGNEIAKICAEKGACYAYRWDFKRIENPLQTKEEVATGKWHIGCDGFAFTKRWWLKHRDELPPFVIGRECWDWILRALISETGGGELQKAIYHEKHESPWKQGRHHHPGNIYNRSYARAWLLRRKMNLREIANAPFNEVAWPPVKWVEKASPSAFPEKYNMDVLIVLGQGSKWHNTELRYCLRALEQNAKGLAKVWVVGYNPGFLSDQVGFLPHTDKPHNKEARIAEAIMVACEKLPISENFLWINDDVFLTQETDIVNYPYYTDGPLDKKWRRTKPGGYRVALAQTDAQLRAKNLTTHNYEQHVPIRYNKSKFIGLKNWVELSIKCPLGLTFRSVYGNVLGVTPTTANFDSKIGSATTAEELEAKVKGRPVFSIGDGLSEDAKGYFHKLWPTPSRFEK